MRISLLIAGLLALGATVAAAAAPARYLLQKDESVVGFTWMLGPDAVNGTMPVTGADLVIDFDSVANSHVAVTLDVARAEAGLPFATEALKGPKVLDAGEYPEIAFKSRQVLRDGDGAKVEGDLTIRGVTRPVVFDAKLYRQRGTEAGDRRLMSVVVTGTVNRSDFGADGWAGTVGDRVKLTILARMQLAE